MKVFTSIKSTVTGVVEHILVSNGTAVEYGQALFLIRPDGK
jgi:biotin carboxyl carrier protein